MILSEPPESNYDLRFEFLGFPVRVAWSFWLAALIIGYSGALTVDQLFLESSSGPLPWLVLWTGIMLGSILLHELGHAVAFRMCGIESSIVLYHFGGLAVPRGMSGGFGSQSGRGFGRLSSDQQIFISAAGPLAQLLLALAVILIARLLGYGLWGGPSDEMVFPLMPMFFAKITWFLQGDVVTSAGWFALLDFTLFINVIWPLFNLLPVWPLDGGQITRELVYKFGGSLYHASVISLVAAIIMAAWFYSMGSVLGAIFFASFAVTNYQMMNMGGRW
jgi:membrane-associated protease RseP (regulator of RpoE activity)